MLGRVWALKGTRPGIPRDCRHGYCHLFSALCPATGEAIGHVCDRANTSGMNRHLKDIASMVPKGHHALVVFDGAGWHRSKDLVCPDNVSVLRVPPYPPELNPAGNVFRFLKSNHCANRVFETADEVKATVRKVWEDFAGQSERIKSIGHRSWAKLQWKTGKIRCEIWRCLLMVTFEKWYKMWNGDCKNIQIGWMARTIF